MTTCTSGIYPVHLTVLHNMAVSTRFVFHLGVVAQFYASHIVHNRADFFILYIYMYEYVHFTIAPSEHVLDVHFFKCICHLCIHCIGIECIRV